MGNLLTNQNSTSALPVRRPSPFDNSTAMTWEKSLSNMCPHFIRYELIKKKYFSEQMFPTTVLILVFLCGVGLAFISTYLPTLLLSIFPNKRQISRASVSTNYDTSLVLRVRQQQIPPNSDVEKEAIAAMNLALDMEAQGKRDKAQKLYQHALKLDPQHADILTAYGEFLEKHENDIVNADHLYKRALFICPQHSKALINRERISPLVEEIDQEYFNRIDKKLEYFVKVPRNHPGLRRAKKEAYFSYIYHTNAIEGNTLTLAQTRSIVETKIAVGGKSLQEQNEVLGMDSALSYINKTMLGKVGNISLLDILEIHKRVLGHVDPPEAGKVRDTQVFVGEFIPPSPGDVPGLMEEFIEWLNSEEALKLHPVEYAAIAHYKLVVIHPFYDGNGRTSRLLMNLILMQAGYPPTSVRIEDRLTYYETLETANAGDIRPFIRFIAKCTERTLDEFLLATHENAGALMSKLNASENLIFTKEEL